MNRDNEQAREAFTTTLEKMARGGVYDQLAGGFHRYSVDEHWVVPHFEKMLYDNTELLRNYVHGFQSLVREDFLATAQEIVGWLDATMTDRERGGFYASQDADIDLDDDGDYFTWTLDEARAVLRPGELEFAAKYWDIGELGDMHHNPAKNVLHVKQTLAEMAAQSGVAADEPAAAAGLGAQQTAGGARQAAYAVYRSHALHRLERDGGDRLPGGRTRAADGRCAGLCAADADRLLAEAWDGAQTLNHVIAYPAEAASRCEIPGTLDDYAFTVHACIDAWFASGEMKFYHAAVKLADAMIARFYDRDRGRILRLGGDRRR